MISAIPFYKGIVHFLAFYRHMLETREIHDVVKSTSMPNRILSSDKFVHIVTKLPSYIVSLCIIHTGSVQKHCVE